VAQIKSWLVIVGLLPEGSDDHFDAATTHAVRAFQQRQGLSVDGVVGPETYRALEAARWRLGDRPLVHQVGHPYIGDDVLALQHRLLELGFDAGRADGVFGPHTERALRDFQRNCGLSVDGTCGPRTLRALRQLERTVVGGRANGLRESEALRHRGPSLAGKAVVVDPGHGGADRGCSTGDLTEAEVTADLGRRLEGRLVAAGMNAYLTHGPEGCPSDAQRAAFANSTGADVLISLHVDAAPSPHAQGVATYYYGSGRDGGSAAGERLAGLVQREIVARTDFLDARTHAKTWELLRLTRMPAIRLELGYLSHPADAARLASADLRETVVEAILVAIQRLFLPVELDFPTGVLRLPQAAR
jgi:N-acetylmuramoyl-L-alanine amidase